MRKYHQVLLIVISLVSLFGLLLYRKQYVELQSTFDSFNIFGSAETPQRCAIINETKNIHTDTIYPLPNWIKLPDNYYVYSSFWKDSGISVAIGIGKKNVIPKFECHIWHEYHDIIFSVTGSFDYKEIKVENSLNNVYEFYCRLSNKENIKGIPYMFVFVKKNGKYFVPINQNIKTNGKSSVTICTNPDYSGASKISLVEFFSYYQLIGTTDFIVYDILHYGILKKIKSAISAVGLVKSFNILTWNFPYGANEPSEKIALKLDCFHRVYNKVNLVAIVNFEDYIVPKVNKNISSIINYDLSANLVFNYQTCCIDNKSDKLSEKFWPIVLKKTYCVANDESRYVLMNPQEDMMRTLPVTSLAVINSYKSCSLLENPKIVYDGSTKKFIKELLESKLLLLWKSGSLY